MGWFDAEDSHKKVHSGEHEASLTHEMLAGAAGVEAIRAYQKHKEAKGDPSEHKHVKQLLGGFAASAIDKLFETKGLDYLDRAKAKRAAEEQAEALYHEKFHGTSSGGGCSCGSRD